MLLANYAGSTGVISTVTVGDISHKYDSLFAPAGYAFIIWGLIFLLLIGFVGYQWSLLKTNNPRHYIIRTGWWLSLSNLANILWLFCWTNELIGWSVVLILVLLFSLCVLTVRLRLELDDEPLRTIFFVWWPIVFYLGWIMVATIACIAAWLVSIGWKGGVIEQDVWAMIMIVVACALYLFLVAKRNLREAALVGVWAFVAIAVRQWHTHNNIAFTAIAASAILLVATAIHGYKRRYYSPLEKMRRGEWK